MAVDFQVAIDFAQTFLNEARSNLIRFREALAQTTANAEQTAEDALSTSTGLATVLSTRDVILSKLDAVAAIASSIGIAHRWVGTTLQIQDPDHEWVTGPDLRGIKGDKGDKGDTGQNGATWLEGTSDPSDDRPEGDLYVNTTTYNLFVSAGGGFWDQIGNIKGPQGGQGPQGAQGIAALWHTGGAPNNEVGIDGDLWLNSTTGQLYLRTAGTYAFVMNIGQKITTLNFVIDGAGGVVPTVLSPMFPVDFDATIQEVTILNDQAGTISIDIWKTSYANYDGGATHPADGDKINGATPVGTTAAVKNKITDLSGWSSTTLADDDIVVFKVVSNDVVTRCTVSLKIVKV
jgi:hypothetical protein